MTVDDRFADAVDPDSASVPDALPIDDLPSSSGPAPSSQRPAWAAPVEPVRIDDVGLDAGDDEYWQAMNEEDDAEDDDDYLERELDEVNDQDWENLAGGALLLALSQWPMDRI